MLDSSIVKQTIVKNFRIGSFILSQSSSFKTEVLVSSFYSGMMIFLSKAQVLSARHILMAVNKHILNQLPNLPSILQIKC